MGHTSNRWQTGVSVTVGVWQHVVAVYDNGAMRFYYNGTEYTTGLTEGIHSSAGTLTIGANQNGGGNFYTGIIDELLFGMRHSPLLKLPPYTTQGVV